MRQGVRLGHWEKDGQSRLQAWRIWMGIERVDTNRAAYSMDCTTLTFIASLVAFCCDIVFVNVSHTVVTRTYCCALGNTWLLLERLWVEYMSITTIHVCWRLNVPLWLQRTMPWSTHRTQRQGLGPLAAVHSNVSYRCFWGCTLDVKEIIVWHVPQSICRVGYGKADSYHLLLLVYGGYCLALWLSLLFWVCLGTLEAQVDRGSGYFC